MPNRQRRLLSRAFRSISAHRARRLEAARLPGRGSNPLDAGRGVDAQGRAPGARQESHAMTDAVWRLVVARAIDNAALEALAREGATYVSGHSSPGDTSSWLLVRAEDEAAPRSAIERALGEQAFIREARAMPVFVHAPIVPDARSAFEMAAGEETRVGGVVEDETTGGLEVYFELPPGDVDRVFNEARGLYERIANSAG